MKILNLILEELEAWLTTLISAVPGRVGRALRMAYYRLALKESGHLSFGRHVEISCPSNIRMGNGIYLVDGVILRACNNASLIIGDRFSANGNARIIADNGGEIRIGSGVMIGPNVVIRASNHAHKRTDIPIWEQGQTGGKIVIGDDVWIGANVVVVSGVTIGSHVIVAAGAVVTRDVPDYAVVAGVPARLIRDRRKEQVESVDE